MPSSSKTILVAARDSPLSKAQVEEVFQQFKIDYSPIFVKTRGDLDKTTSLRNMEKTNFFTKEIDDLVLQKKCDIAVHSAKDLPEPLPKGLVIVALTKGVDSRDALVFRDECPKNGIIATSSLRREEAVKKLGDFQFIDIRGTIEERLKKLFSKEVDGVVIAEAALIRLKLTHLKRIYLAGEVSAMQGRLAVVAREDDVEMMKLFKNKK